MVTREEHFKLLNDWNQSPEWKRDYSFDFASLIGKRWEINEELWWEFLEVLPPVRWRKDGNGESFFISEALSGNIHSKYIREGDRYFHEWAILSREVVRG